MVDWTVSGGSVRPVQSVVRLKQAFLPRPWIKNQFNIGGRRCLPCQILSWQEQILHMILAKRPRSDRTKNILSPHINHKYNFHHAVFQIRTISATPAMTLTSYNMTRQRSNVFAFIVSSNCGSCCQTSWHWNGNANFWPSKLCYQTGCHRKCM